MKEVLVTRPAHEAAAWVEALSQQGYSAQALPLIDIRPPDDETALGRYQSQADGYDALMFVSPQAVRHFAAPSWTLGRVRCWAPGPGTARALEGQGVGARRIDQPPSDASQFDSESLWAVVASQVVPGHRLLMVRGQSADGETGRDWLVRQCEAAGGLVDTCIAYRRCRPDWSDETADRARQQLQNGAIWLFSSAEGLDHLEALLPGVSFAQGRALVTHPRIEMSARRMGFGEIITTRPALADVLSGLQACR
jgi:uroporphyrinogen-III synthase